MKILQEGIATDLNSTVATHQNHEHTVVTQQEDQLSKDEGDSVSASDNSSGMDNISTTESASNADNISMTDNVSVASHGSASTAVTVNTEAEELIEKLKGMVMRVSMWMDVHACFIMLVRKNAFFLLHYTCLRES